MTKKIASTKAQTRDWAGVGRNLRRSGPPEIFRRDPLLGTPFDADCPPALRGVIERRYPYLNQTSSPSVSEEDGESWYRVVKHSFDEDVIGELIREYHSPAHFEPKSIDVHGFKLCSELLAIARRIEASRYILDLEDNWDDEGSTAYNDATWRAAVQLVVESANQYWRSTHKVAPLPAIAPGPDGSIDVTWIVGTRNLLVNVPSEGAGSVTFSGLDTANRDRVVKGRLPADASHEWLMAWLTT